MSVSSSQIFLERIFALFIALLMGYFFVVSPAQETWKNY